MPAELASYEPWPQEHRGLWVLWQEAHDLRPAPLVGGLGGFAEQPIRRRDLRELLAEFDYVGWHGMIYLEVLQRMDGWWLEERAKLREEQREERERQ